MVDRHRRLGEPSHTIRHGLVTYPGLPGPEITDHLSRETSAGVYGPDTSFHIGRISMVANTGTYLDSPFHRFATGADLSEIPIDRLADLEGIVVDANGQRGIDRERLRVHEVRGKAVLLHTGWDRHWRTDQYFRGHPFLTKDAAQWLADRGAALVGIDSLNIDDNTDGERPVHTILLGAGIPIAEHLTNLAAIPAGPFHFTAAPVKVKAMGSFPVRAFAAVAEP